MNSDADPTQPPHSGLYYACRVLEFAIAATVTGWALYHAVPYMSLFDSSPESRFGSSVATVALFGAGLPLGMALIAGMLGYAAEAMPLGTRAALNLILFGGVVAVLIAPLAGW